MTKEITHMGRLILEPIARRLGTAVAAYLVASGLPADAAQQVLVALGILGGVAWDVSISVLTRKDR